MKKVIIIATVYGFIKSFEMNNIKILQDLGYEVHTFANDTNTTTGSKVNVEELENLNIHTHFVCFHRNPLHIDNYKAYKEILDFIDENKDIMLIDCHTPVGGVVGRLIAKKAKIKCLYTAHGFHFYKGAPLKNWMIYYSIEKWLSRYTDILITINKEDYNRAKEKFHMKEIKHVAGIGVDLNKFQLKYFNRTLYRKNLGFDENDFVILSVGELNRNKNHEIVLKAISRLNNPKIKYIIAGQGELYDYLNNLARKLNIANQIQLLGYRKDIVELDHIADLYILPSRREGLNVSLMEAMASGVSCVASNIRGNKDLVDNCVNGFLCDTDDVESYVMAIGKIFKDYNIRNKFINNSLEVINNFSLTQIQNDMKSLYANIEINH